MKKVIKTDIEFNNFCDNNSVIFKLPQENSGKYYMLINTFTSEASTGLSDSNNKCDQNWELKSSYTDSNGTVFLVFEVWANPPMGVLPGSVDFSHSGKKLEITLNQVLRVVSQLTSNNPSDIWFINKIKNAHVLENYI